MSDLKHWIGRREERVDGLDPARAQALLASLEQAPAVGPGDLLPPLFHWLYFWDVKPPSQTGPDGHPKRGGFLPPVPLPRRMWAGGEAQFLSPLRLGEQARKVSTIADVKEKSGRSGALTFVTVEHQVFGPEGLAIRERQDLVYRAPAGKTAPPLQPEARSGEPGEWREALDAGPVLLFRYSALTMNSHRIHYDRRFAVEEEGYEGLVVHGPLQATMMMGLASRKLRSPVVRFGYRGLSPAVDLRPIVVCGQRTDDGAELWVEQDGRRTMSAHATACEPG